jgi:two-component system chemotaxis response regulator CheY
MLKMVVMDGNSISRGLLISVLTNGGHLVVGDSNVSHAGIARMIKLKPQLICIDLEQVEDDPMATLDQIRSELPKTIVFLVSNKFDAEAIRIGVEHGARGFIVKPFNTVQVLTSVRNVVMKFVREMKKGGESAGNDDAQDDSEDSTGP